MYKWVIKILISGFPLFPGLILLPEKTSAQYDIDVLKMAYIERITRFIEWPELSLPEANDTIVFGFIAADEIEDTSREIFKSQKIKGLPVKVVKVTNSTQLAQCHLCYVGNADHETLTIYFAISNREKILLFGQTSDFAKKGLHINFYIEEDKLKFEINKKTTQAAGFKVSHLLMQTARII